MVRKWVKILPYCLVIWFTKKFSGDIHFEHQKNKFTGWRIDKGEWVMWSQSNYDTMRKNERERHESKLDKKKARINKILDKDYSLRQSLKEDIENEIENDKHDSEY